MSLSTNLKAVSKKLIDKFGNSVTLHVKTLGAWDPLTMTQTIIETDYSTKGVSEDMRGEYNSGGDVMLTFYLDTDIKEVDNITVSGTKRAVLSLQKVEAQDTVIIYQALLSGDGTIVNG